MATAKQTLRDDLTSAMRNRDEVRVATLRMVLTGIRNDEVSGDVERELSDAEVDAVLRREAKRRREAVVAYGEAGRPDRAEREQAELAVLDGYLPAPLGAREVTELVAQAIQDTSAQGPRAMGQVMKAVQPVVAGRADGAAVSAEVRRQLAQ